MKEINQKVDVICQNSTDGRIIPLKIRLVDEDGIRQQYIIKSYREVAAFTDGYTMPNGAEIAPNCTKRKFECEVNVFGRMQKFYLVFSLTDLTWRLEVCTA